MRKAVIDLGTNTFHLLIAEIQNGQIHELYKNQIPVKLGEGGIDKQLIAAAAFERGQRALEEFRATLNQWDCKELRVVATSAIRNASNGDLFIEEAKKRSQIEIKTISGLEEAKWIARGVMHSLPPMESPYLIMDIGGGSVEFILCHQGEIKHKQSIDIGAARLLAKFNPSDPLNRVDLALITNYLEEKLSGVIHQAQHLGASILVGSAGSFESILELIEDLKGPLKPINPACYTIALEDFAEIHQRLLVSTKVERENMKGLADYRVEMMVLASILIDTVLSMGRISSLYCSTHSLKEGVLLG